MYSVKRILVKWSLKYGYLIRNEHYNSSSAFAQLRLRIKNSLNKFVNQTFFHKFLLRYMCSKISKNLFKEKITEKVQNANVDS